MHHGTRGIDPNTAAPKSKRPRSLRTRLRHLLTRGARPAFNRWLARHSKVGDPVIFGDGTFAWTKHFEESAAEIRAEALGLYSLRETLPSFHDVSPYQARISRGDDWKTTWLHGFGTESDVAQALCPRTTALLAEVPGLQTALFSMLAPGTHIPPHRGVYKGLINYHLGLVIPKDAERCRMQVAKERVVWREGEGVVFDDTNRHEVWNDTNEERIVLMLQFERPFRSPGHELSRLFLWVLKRTPYLRIPRRNVREFDSLLRAAAKARGLLPE
jgi:ornithine lipid ester-linked acyl 2-hydroxylase